MAYLKEIKTDCDKTGCSSRALVELFTSQPARSTITRKCTVWLAATRQMLLNDLYKTD